MPIKLHVVHFDAQQLVYSFVDANDVVIVEPRTTALPAGTPLNQVMNVARADLQLHRAAVQAILDAEAARADKLRSATV